MPARFKLMMLMVITLTCLWGCGDDPEPAATGLATDAGAVDGVGGADGGGDTTAPPVANPWEAPDESDAWRILFNYRGRMPTNSAENDLWLMGAWGSDKESLTDLSGLKFEDPPLSCNYGCVISPDLSWLAVVTEAPTSTGFTFELGQFDEKLEIKMLKFGSLKNVVDFKFAGSRLFYSKKTECDAPSCQYDVYVIDLAVGAASTKILTYPTATELEHSTYKGHFKVSQDGSKVVLLNTTIRSVTVNMWADGTGLYELDYICKFGTKGNCAGTGSEYSDVDPVAISPDGRYVVFFTYSDRWQRARLYDTENPGIVRLSVLASVPSGSYLEHACDGGNLASWQWERVIGDPIFTPDGTEVIFLTESDCPTSDTSACGDEPAPCLPKKPRTNLRRIKLDTLLSEKTITQDDVLNVTGNPFGDVTDNKRVTGFSLSDDGATIVFTATPSFSQNNTPISDGSARQRNDREVYRIRTDGTNLNQISNDLEWQAESPRVVPLQNPTSQF
jgi:Tol biopolymer transport system component